MMFFTAILYFLLTKGKAFSPFPLGKGAGGIGHSYRNASTGFARAALTAW